MLKYDPLAGSSYFKLPKELDHPRKGLINVQNISDNECFKWCEVTYTLEIIIQEELENLTKYMRDKLDFKDIKFPVKVRDIPKIERKNSFGISVFGYDDDDDDDANLYVKKML